MIIEQIIEKLLNDLLIIMFQEIIIYIFWFLFSLIINTYLFYPLLMGSIGKIKKLQRKATFEPTISILISVYNEEEVIVQRIENIAKQNYDFNKVEVLIGSDASTDLTNKLLDEIRQKYSWLTFYPFPNRLGKMSVLNQLVSSASNEILVFTDANTIYKENALIKLVRRFSDNRIGGISGKLELFESRIKNFNGVEEKTYWNLENLLKAGEGNIGVLISSNGGNYAIRASLISDISIDKPVTDDIFLTLSILEKGYKFIFENESVAVEEISNSIKVEFERKVRISATNFQTLFFFRRLLYSKPLIVAYGFWSHKVLRWIFPIIALLLFTSNLIIYNLHYFYTFFFKFQILFFIVAVIGGILSLFRKRFVVFSVPFYFAVANLALLLGLIRFLRNKHSVTWE